MISIFKFLAETRRPGRLFAGLVCVGSAVAQRPLEFSDIIEMRDLSSPRLSPDGNSVAFIVRQSSLANNSSKTSL